MAASIKFWCLLILALGLAGESLCFPDNWYFRSTILKEMADKNWGEIGKNCSLEYGPRLLSQFNSNRALHGYKPLTLSPMLSSAAEKEPYKFLDTGSHTAIYEHATNHTSQYGLLFATILEYTTEKSFAQRDFFPALTGNQPDSLQHFWTKRIVPPEKQANYTDQLWAATSKMGVACMTKNLKGRRWRKGDEDLYTRRVMVLFDYPSGKQPVATRTPPPTTLPPSITRSPSPSIVSRDTPSETKVYFSVPMNHCPQNFSEAILAKFNAQRRANNALPLALSPAITEDAQDWVSNAGPDEDLKADYTQYGQLGWRKWWQSSLATRFEVSPDEPFRLQWTEEASLPLYTGGSKRRQYRWREWLMTSQLGLGCSVLKKTQSGLGDVVVLRVVVFFNYMGPRSRPGQEQKPSDINLTCSRENCD